MSATQPPFSRRQVLGLMGMGFFVLASYAIARPAVESLFIEAWGATNLPWAWLAVAVVAVLVTTAYNRLAARAPLRRVYQIATGFSCVTLAVLVGLVLVRLPGAVFALYVWKDVYVVVLLECLWTIANTSFAIKSARWLYGLFCVVGTFGGMSANVAIGPIARSIGSLQALWLVIPLLAVSAASAGLLSELAAPRVRSEPGTARSGAGAGDPDAAASDGWAVLRGSRYLLLMLALIVTVQLVITLVDYQFNVMVEQSYPDTDERTGVIGQVYAAIDVGSLTLQLLTGPLLQLIGVGGTLLGIPLIIGGTVLAFALSPYFLTMAVAKIAGKCFDYSIFRAAKEILYIPLTYPEKSQGKALVDIMSYRVAKGGASLLVLGFAAAGLFGLVTALTCVLVLAWLVLTVFVTRRYRARTAQTAD